jgi:hypothetical protein
MDSLFHISQSDLTKTTTTFVHLKTLPSDTGGGGDKKKASFNRALVRQRYSFYKNTKCKGLPSNPLI